ncbi:MAG TPA: KpsF/GutQ family sugar-phosphate isomerase [Acidobacteriota bacterium]|nr:KpsF/GutQ family sugar-phosphate isomerase [Acidobacteriota bacterium]
MIRNTAREVLAAEAAAIAGLQERIGPEFEKAVEILAACKGRLVVTGMGKSGLICRKLAATFSSTGLPALFLHPAEAIHGDLGMVVTGDLVLALSNSGETGELLRLLELLKRLDVPLIAMTGNPQSTLARHSEVVLDVSVAKEACPMNLVPTASTTAALAMGDALAMCVMVRRGFKEEDFARLHPGGKLGRKLMKVSELMRSGDAIPWVRADTPMKDVIYEMSKKGIGITSVLDSVNRVVGIISDGDLRRHLEQDSQLLSRTAGDVMTRNPKTIGGDELATRALYIMEEKKITSLLILDAERRILGVIHLHDLWRTELI